MESNYRLLGGNVKNSFSPEIHKFLGGYNYTIQEVSDIENVFKEKDFLGLNVTMPYKEQCIKFLDVLDRTAKEIKAVNTVINKDGVLYGFNTDVYGIERALNKNKISVKGKNVLILGSGGASHSAVYVMKRLKAKEIYICSRTGKVNYENVYSTCKDAQILINATPVGSVNFKSQKSIDLTKFNHVKAVFDMIYNPLKTPLILQAEKLKLKTACGLDMLVFQAIKSAELFLGKKINKSSKDCRKYILNQKRNIVLIGLGGVGKTTIGKLLAQKLNRQFFDTDEEFAKTYKILPCDYIKKSGEQSFREKEEEIVKNLSKNTNCIIATGGGVPIKETNRDLLKQNGYVIWLKRKIDYVDKTDRPIYNTITPKELYKKRKKIYKEFSNLTVKNNDIEKTADKIIRKIK